MRPETLIAGQRVLERGGGPEIRGSGHPHQVDKRGGVPPKGDIRQADLRPGEGGAREEGEGGNRTGYEAKIFRGCWRVPCFFI
jgi:hypothetical protein